MVGGIKFRMLVLRERGCDNFQNVSAPSIIDVGEKALQCTQIQYNDMKLTTVSSSLKTSDFILLKVDIYMCIISIYSE